MSTVTTVLNYSRAQGQTDSNGLTDANGLIFVNAALLDVRRDMIKKGIDASQVQEAYLDGGTANGRSAFLYPSDFFALKTIEVNFMSTVQQDYKTAQQVDAANLPMGQSFDYLRVNQPTTEPLFDDRGDWYEIFPAFSSAGNISQAIKLIYFLQPTEYTSVSDTLTYPDTLDYRILGMKTLACYLGAQEKYDGATYWNNEYLKAINALDTTLGRGSQQPIQPTGLPITGWEF